ncbi:MAG: vWA domain-containing protein [Roseiflexus sp.]
MPTLTLSTSPGPLILEARSEPQVCYVLLTVRAATTGDIDTRPVNWALVADASRSMRIPIIDEVQFRSLLRNGSAHETLVDGIPVWQLSGSVPQEVRKASSSALDHVVHALHTVVERLDRNDRLSLIVFADQALLLIPGMVGSDRVTLVRAIERLPGLDLGDGTNLADGIELALNQIRANRDPRRANRILLLTDGFTRDPAACLRLADQAADEYIAITTIGLGGEFQDDLLTAIADRSGGNALFLKRASAIPRAISAELESTRVVAIPAVDVAIAPIRGITLRRVTRIRSVLAVLAEPSGAAASDVVSIPLGDLPAGAPVTLLLEFFVPAASPGPLWIAGVAARSAGVRLAEVDIMATIARGAPPLSDDVRMAAARAMAARLIRRATTASDRLEAARLMRAAAARFDELGESALAAAAREQAAACERGVRIAGFATRELTYATRRLGDVS